MMDSLINQCLLMHQHQYRRRFNHLQKKKNKGQSIDAGLSALNQQIERSLLVVQSRQAELDIHFPPELPISTEREKIDQLIERNQVVILCGETGSGKSTQLPKICLSMGRGVLGRIGHTQPRRLAARSLAQRISVELQQPLGEVVGYKVRFKEQVKPQTRIKLMTDGMLLAEIQQDKWLNEYDTLIIDEAHERSLNIDFLLGYLSTLLKKRKDLKLIITSATIDPQRFAKHFSDAPVLNVSGRTFPVEVRYRPIETQVSSERDEELQNAIVMAVHEISRIDQGDVLIFLSGEREIRETADTLSKQKLGPTDVLPLYARLSASEQNNIFSTSNKRRIILSTNVAETSLTVPGIHYVIDAGFARISRYSHRSKVQRLPVERISQASANQRKGRCGRVAAGVCIRLYSQEDFESRPEFTEPEILRTNLATVILQMKALQFGEIEHFPFVEMPDARMIKDGYRVLHEIGAVDRDSRITHLGKKLARLPVDPRVGKMLMDAGQSGCLKEVLVIASALSVQDPRDRPMDRQQQADEAHRRYQHADSDFLSFYQLWQHLQEKKQALSRRQFFKACKKSFLSPTRVQEWMDIHHQMRQQMQEMGFCENDTDSDYDNIHQSLLTGLLSHIGFKTQGKDSDYLGARNSHFHVFPGSVLFKTQPKWLMSAELVETTRLYARTNAKIDPKWIEALSGHLIKRSYSEPHWQKRRGQVGARERVTLYGLTIVSERRVNFGPINPIESREIFIRSALVEGDFESSLPFWKHNRQLIDYVNDLEARSRRLDIMVDEQVLYEFYDQRLPEGIYSKAKFEQWLKKASLSEPELLFLSEQDLMRHQAHHVTKQDYPDSYKLGAVSLPLEYHFDPRHEHDGVSLVVPVALINQVSEVDSDWLVPGMLRDKMIALLRGLPKQYRRQLVPIPDTVDQLLQHIKPHSEISFIQQIGTQIKRLTGVYIAEDQWNEHLLEKHLQMNYKIVDANQKELAISSDLYALKQRFAEQAEQHFTQLPLSEKIFTGCKTWCFGDIEETQTIKQSGMDLMGYPALIDEGDTVGLTLMDSKQRAQESHQQALLKLLKLVLPKEIRSIKKSFTGLDRMRLQYAKVPQSSSLKLESKDLQDILLDWVLLNVFLSSAQNIRSQATFDAAISEGRKIFLIVAQQSCQQLSQLLTTYQQLRKALSQANQMHWMASIKDMNQQLDHLVFHGFLNTMNLSRLKSYSRYLKAMQLRLEKLKSSPDRDQQLMRDMLKIKERWQQRYDDVLEKGRCDERLEEIRWMIEELRISFFAQEVKTAFSISIKRIDKRWVELGL